MSNTSADVDVMIARARLLSSPTRVALWCAVGEVGMYASDLASSIGISRATASHHLGILHDAGLITFTRQGRHRLYVWSSVRLAILTEDELQAAAASP